MNRLWKEKIIRMLLLSVASTSILIIALIFLFLGKEAFPFIKQPGLFSLFGSRWVPVSFQQALFGIFSLLTGSFLVTLLAMAFTIPFGVCGAIYISEFANRKEREFLKPFIELLAGIPSVVIGFFGLMIVAPLIKEAFQLQSGLNALSGALLLALMAIPTVVSISEDAIRSVPLSYKEAALSLGASKMETVFKITVPAASSGIIAAAMLGMGRIIGETMVVLMVTGNAAVITFSPFESVRTMTATIAAEMGEVPVGSTHYQALFWIGIILLLITFGLILITQRVLKKMKIM